MNFPALPLYIINQERWAFQVLQVATNSYFTVTVGVSFQYVDLNLITHVGFVLINCFISAPLSKNAVSALQISCQLLSFTFKDSWRNWQTINTLPELEAVSTISNIYVHTTFYRSSGLTRNVMFNGSIYYILYLQILRFHLVGHM